MAEWLKAPLFAAHGAIVTLLCIAATIAADRAWLNGKYFATAEHQLGLNISSGKGR